MDDKGQPFVGRSRPDPKRYHVRGLQKDDLPSLNPVSQSGGRREARTSRRGR